MTTVAARNLKQYAVLWEASGKNSFAETTIKKPVEIKCRWEDKRSQTLDENNNVLIYDGTVYLSCEVPEDSILWLGRLMDKPNDSEITNLHEVVVFSKKPNLKNTKYEYKATVRNYKNKLPAFA